MMLQLNTHRGGQAVELTARHAELERDDRVCRLTEGVASYPGGQARAAAAIILFRDDGSAARLDASNGFSLATSTGGHVAAPTGTLNFDDKSQPTQGILEGGVTIDSISKDRTVHGAAPEMNLQFTAAGVLKSAHLERGVKIESDQRAGPARGTSQTHQGWTSQTADLQFRNTGHGQLELASIRGAGGVVLTDESRRDNGPASPSRMTADDVTGTFGAGMSLTRTDWRGPCLH